MAETTFEKPETKTCEACGAEFSCGARSDKCWCFEIKLPPENHQKINLLFNDCLCPACLSRFGRDDSETESELVQS